MHIQQLGRCLVHALRDSEARTGPKGQLSFGEPSEHVLSNSKLSLQVFIVGVPQLHLVLSVCFVVALPFASASPACFSGSKLAATDLTPKENFFCLYFTVEIIIRFIAFQRKINAFKNFWTFGRTNLNSAIALGEAGSILRCCSGSALTCS